ncbi:MAG TPA: tetratricopeptide repeat protein [Acidobacteriota bacterium]|nr:tetratricopeptide repeat protein [Acidobacteriota bacterium]
MGLTRKEIKQDEVRSTLETVFDWLLAHQVQIIAGLAVLVVVILGGWGWSVYQQGVNREANAAFADALDKYHAPVGDEAQDAPAGTFRYRYDSQEKKLAEALPAFQSVADGYGGSSVGPWAQLYVAVIHQEQGQTEKAEEIFRRLASDASILEVRNLAAKRMADKARRSGNLDEAVSYCRQILDNTAVNFPVEGTLLTLAEIYEEQGDTASALEQYRILQAEHPNSPQARTAESKIEELAPPLLTETPPEAPEGDSSPQPQER